MSKAWSALPHLISPRTRRLTEPCIPPMSYVMVKISPEKSIGTPGEDLLSEEPGQYKDQKCRDCYALALRSAAEYAVDLDTSSTQAFQRHVRALAERAAAEVTSDDLRTLQASFRGELREFRDAGRLYVQRLRDDLNGATEVMQTFATSLISNGDDVQQRVRNEMSNLEKAAESGDLERIRESVRTTVKEVIRSYEELNKTNALVTAELQHEIRLLHQNMEAERRLAWTDPTSGAWIKKKLDNRLDELTKTSEPFCVIVILVTNLKRLKTQCSAHMVHQALNALVKRFYGILGSESLIARLNEDHFAAVVEVDSAAAQIMARQVGARLSSRYSVQNDGNAESIDISVNCGIVARPRDSDPGEFTRKLRQMTGVGEMSESIS
jgi:GGDEF domain-containing protein